MIINLSLLKKTAGKTGDEKSLLTYKTFSYSNKNDTYKAATSLSTVITCDNGNFFVAKSIAGNPDLAKQIIVDNILELNTSELEADQAQIAFLAPAQADDPYWWEARETTESDPRAQAYWRLKGKI
jgi:hypothetical protein